MNSGILFEKTHNDKQIKNRLHPSLFKELVGYFSYFIRVFLIVALVYVFVRSSLFDVIGISGKSMYPTYDNLDAIYIDLLTPKFAEYRRGEVVILLSPEVVNGQKEFFIKRIIGLPGEKVVFEDGKTYIYNDDYPDGVELDEKAYLSADVKTYKRADKGGQRYEEDKLGAGEYFVLGDNRTASSDSRVFGKIQKREIVGKEFYRILPSEKSGSYKIPKYNISN